MCGIVGFINNIDEKEDTIKKMMNKIYHRGPDEGNYYIDESISLGHRRLSILDISGGKQPMFTKDKSLVVIFNGEIYNYKELKSELITKNYEFETNSDTEILLIGYREWGVDLPKHLRGMFSFALFDKTENILFCARDHFGIKPFYYYKNNDTFIFASEIKAFLEHPKFLKEFNEEILPSYLAFGFSPTNETFFKNVYSLKPGHTLIFKDGECLINPYFSINFKEDNKPKDKEIDEIEKVIIDSLNHHLISDVEIGSFLSSGIDSSYIVSLAKPDKTYTVGYNISKYNESNDAKDLTKKLGIKNISKKISKKEYIDSVEKIMYYMDEPISDPAAVALYFVANLASKDVKVVLSGEGADEFFAGYNYYREEVDYSFYNKIPFSIRHIIAKICSFLPEIRGINFLVRRGLSLEENYIGVNKIFSDKEIQKVSKDNKKCKTSIITAPIYKRFKDKSNIIKRQAIDINFWLVKDILHKADRMTMANSIESRVPFVDIEVFKVASKLSFDSKINKTNTKVALREAAKRTIPNQSYNKKKLGFPVPIRNWMRDDDIYTKIKDTFKEDYTNKFFNQKYILKLLDQHKNGKKDNYKKVWTIYCFLVWYKVFFIEN